MYNGKVMHEEIYFGKIIQNLGPWKPWSTVWVLSQLQCEDIKELRMEKTFSIIIV